MIKLAKEICDYREMIIRLVHRDLRGRYKGSVLGILWAFVSPLLQLFIYTVVFSVVMRAAYEKYYLFLFVALIPWIFFSSSISAGATAIVSQQSLVNKIYFPREVLPIAHVISQLVNMLISFVVIFLVLIFTGHGVRLGALYFLPLIILIEFVMALGFTFLTSSLNVYFRDMEFILAVLIMGWQFLSPVMYGIDMVPEKYRLIFRINPMTPVMNIYRDILYYRRVPAAADLLYSSIFAIVIFVIGLLVFEKLKRRFSEEL